MIIVGNIKMATANKLLVYKSMVIKAGERFIQNGQEYHSVAIVAHRGSPFIYSAPGTLADVFDGAKRFIDGLYPNKR